MIHKRTTAQACAESPTKNRLLNCSYKTHSCVCGLSWGFNSAVGHVTDVSFRFATVPWPEARYVHACRTGEQSQRHPNFENFQELIQCARQEGPPEDNLRRTLLSFPSGASQSVQDGFVFDFASQSRLDPASSACQDVNNFIQPCSWSAKLLRCAIAHICIP